VEEARAGRPGRTFRGKPGRKGSAGAGGQGNVFAYARVDAESSIFRWFMTRHGDQVMVEAPGLLARLAAGGCRVALVFRADRAAALLAWTSAGPGEAEILAAYAVDPRATPWDFAFGPAGPLAADGVRRVWTYTDRSAQAKQLRRDGFKATPSRLGGRGTARLERAIGAEG
jgi:hypothetical protein